MPTALVLNDTSHMHHHGCRRVIENLRRGLQRHGFTIGGSWHGLSYLDDPRFAEALQTADALIVNGEGTIHHDRRAAKVLVDSARLADSAGCPAFLINTTWMANSAELARATRRFRMVCVRESLSLRALQAQGAAAEIVPDLTFYSGSREPRQPNGRIAVTDSTRQAINRQLYRFSAEHSQCDYLPVLAPFRAVPQMPKRRRKIARHAAYAAMGRMPILNRAVPVHYRALKFARPDTESYLDALAGRSGVITGRFHSLCFALQTATPFLAVGSNSHKIESLLSDIGLPPERLVACDQLTAALLSRQDLVAFSDTEAERVCRYVAEAPRRIDAMFAGIAAACGAQKKVSGPLFSRIGA